MSLDERCFSERDENQVSYNEQDMDEGIFLEKDSKRETWQENGESVVKCVRKEGVVRK